MLSLTLLVLACGSPATGSTPERAAADAPAAPEAPAVETIDVRTLQSRLDAGQVPLLVDVRTPGEYAAGHVAGAKSMPLDQLDSWSAQLDAGQPVHVICQSGGRSARAADALRRKGFTAVNVQGGTGAWIAAGLPVAQ